MKKLTIFFVLIVQLIYVCDSWKTIRYDPNLTHEHRTSTCPWLHKPKFAKMMCRSNGRGSICTAKCLAQHVFKDTRQNTMTLQCRHNNRWVPRAKFPDCVFNGLCRLTTVGKVEGEITCKTDKVVLLVIFCHLSGSPVSIYSLLFFVSANGLCRLTTVGEGKITCKTNNALKHCTITCEDKTYNWYVCDPSGRWNRPLPQCAKDRNGRRGVQF